MNTGYRGMLRDRLLPSWNLALLWCKVKERWIEKVYKDIISKTPKPLRSDICKFVTGHKNKDGITCSFFSTVDPDGFLFGDNKIEYDMWRNVSKWVNWFSKNQMFIYDTLSDVLKNHYIFCEIVDEMCKHYNNIDKKLIEFMIKNKHIYYGTTK